MSPTPIACLMGYVLWTIVLVLGIGAVRVTQVMTGKTPPNGFPSGTQHGSAMYWRLNRAHLNATENLAMFAAVVLAGKLTSVDAPTFATLAFVTLCARIAQSIFHVASGSSLVVNLRFTAFCVQLGCIVTMALQVISHVMS